MIDRAVHPAEGDLPGTALHHEIARGDAASEAARPVLRQLVETGQGLPLPDEVIARVRGMLEGLVISLLEILPDHGMAGVEPLTRALIGIPALLQHLHAAALEWQATERLQIRLALDPVVSPLLEDLLSQGDTTLRDLAARFLSSQARWCHLQRDLGLALTELPRELFQAVLPVFLAQAAHHPGAARAEQGLRQRYDEAATRHNLARQLVSALEGGPQAALSISHAGLALFLTALALDSGQEREVAVQSIDQPRTGRLALALRSAGLGLAEIERQLVTLHPDTTLPRGLEALDSHSAAALLNSGPGEA